MHTTQTIALLFSDLVGSTQLAQALGSSPMEDVRRDHFSVLRGAIAGAGGTEVKSVGDGLMVACPSAGSAVSCAVAIQQGVELRNRADGPQLAVRVGVALGDVAPHEGDWYGNAATEARRLCDLAAGGQILVTDVVRLLAAAEGPVMRPLGPRLLKGLTEPIETWSIEWEPLPPAAATSLLPAPLRAVSAASFVGRGDERDRVAAAWERARDGARSLVLVAGEPGIGKTRLVTHLAAHAQADGAIVLYGRSIEGAGLPYEPWRQALTQLVDSIGADLLNRHTQRYGGDLVRLAPSIDTRLHDVPKPKTSDPETERYLLFGATVGLIAEAAHAAPVVLIIDDLHWSGRPTLALLKHVQLAAPPSIRLLLIGTHRDQVRPEDALTEVLGELRRDPTVERVGLTGLSEDEVLTLLEATAGDGLNVPSSALARVIHRETSGNPFFVTEVVRHLTESGSILSGVDGRWTAALNAPDLPRSVQEVIMARVMQLGPQALRVLSTAAVIGRDFDLALLARVEDTDEDELVQLLDMARSAALLTDSSVGAGRYSFVHALVTHALEAHLSATRRARLHKRIAEALEQDSGANRRLGELATHWAAAGQGSRANAVHYAGAAGRAALAQLAPDEAAEWFEGAITLHGNMLSTDHAARRELLLGLGEAQLHAGNADFRETLLEAAEQARKAGDHGRLIRAALANWRGFASSTGFVDVDRVAALEAALMHVPSSDARRARLLAQLAAELLWDPDHERRLSLSNDAKAIAREHGDEATLAHVLTLRATAVWWPETLDERRRDAEELIALTDGLNDPRQRFWARTWSAITAIQDADCESADRCLETMREIAGRLAHPRLSFVMATQESWRAQLSGRIDVAEQFMERAAVIGNEAGEADALTLYAAQLAPIRWHQGRLAEVADMLEQMAGEVPAVSLFQAMDALARSEAGNAEQAAELLDAHTRRDFSDIWSDPVRLTALAIWAEVAGRLESAPAAEILLRHLEPLREQVVLDSLGAFGAISRCAGVVAGVLGRRSEADAHFAHALVIHERMHAASLVVRTRMDWGVALGGFAGSEEASRARELLAQAEAGASELGLPTLARRAATIRHGMNTARESAGAKAASNATQQDRVTR